jgi:hypothetical protein
MTTDSVTLFHNNLRPLLNIHALSEVAPHQSSPITKENQSC